MPSHQIYWSQEPEESGCCYMRIMSMKFWLPLIPWCTGFHINSTYKGLGMYTTIMKVLLYRAGIQRLNSSNAIDIYVNSRRTKGNCPISLLTNLLHNFPPEKVCMYWVIWNTVKYPVHHKILQNQCQLQSLTIRQSNITKSMSINQCILPLILINCPQVKLIWVARNQDIDGNEGANESDDR